VDVCRARVQPIAGDEKSNITARIDRQVPAALVGIDGGNPFGHDGTDHRRRRRNNPRLSRHGVGHVKVGAVLDAKVGDAVGDVEALGDLG